MTNISTGITPNGKKNSTNANVLPLAGKFSTSVDDIVVLIGVAVAAEIISHRSSTVLWPSEGFGMGDDILCRFFFVCVDESQSQQIIKF